MIEDPDRQALVVLCTCPSSASAETLGESLVAARLAACVNIVPGATSIYRWEGEIERGVEVLLVIKTTRRAFPALEQALKAGHPYELPEIVAVPVASGSNEYLAWLDASTR